MDVSTMFRRRNNTRFAIATAVAVTIALTMVPAAHADGIDVTTFLRRYDTFTPVYVGIAKIAGFMLVNFVLNFLVIALPALVRKQVQVRRSLRDVAIITLWGQITDRAGALLALLTVVPLAILMRLQTLLEVGVLLLFLTFVYSGLGFYLLTLYFVRRRWGLPEGMSKLVSLAAAIVCNPAWVLLPASMS